MNKYVIMNCEKCLKSFNRSKKSEYINLKLCRECIFSQKFNLRAKVNLSTLKINYELCTAEDPNNNKLPVKMHFMINCLSCHKEYDTYLSKERKKKHRWNCKSCAIKKEWKNIDYLEIHKLTLKASANLDKNKKRSSITSKNNWANPSIREKMTNGSRNRKEAAKKGKETLKKNLLLGKTKIKILHGKWQNIENIRMRSTYELRFATFLKSKNLNFQYEPKPFELKSGALYTPDFWIESLNLFVEVKGWWRDDAKEKFYSFIEEYKEYNHSLIMLDQLKKLESGEIEIESCINKTSW